MNLLGNVLAYKQELFNSRGDWIQQKMDELADLNSLLLRSNNQSITNNIKGQYYSDKQMDELMKNIDYNNKVNDEITILVNKLNVKALDLSDDSIFNKIKGDIKTVERLIYNFWKK